MSMERVLILEEDLASLKVFKEVLKSKKKELSIAESVEGLLLHLSLQPFDLFFCRIENPEMIPLEILKIVKEAYPDIVVIFITPFDAVEKAAEAIRHGAFNYLIRPFSSDTLEAMIEKAEEHAQLLLENDFLRSEISSHAGRKREQIIAESPLMKQILQDIAKIAKSTASVFISGESGTGKEVIAHAIHYQSQRASNPFVKVNCAAIPETLIESEFFGHEKGSFTGAIARRSGRFELADKGTLLLDEISEIPLTVQSKLLRAVQEMEFERIGGTKSIQVDVRLISTSNRNMKEAIENKIFREDLYYRLNVVPIQIPPLRDRREDILPLAEYFLERLCQENHKPKKRLSEEACKKLLDYYWPGNIRELANIMERSVVMNSGLVLEPEQLCLDSFTCKTDLFPSLIPPVVGQMTLEELEKKHILETLATQNQNKTKAAKILGISIRTLRNKLKQYQIC